MISGRCDTCMWFQPTDKVKKAGTGECHQRAPLPAVMEKTNDKKKYVTVWPEVDSDGWCGAFKEESKRR